MCIHLDLANVMSSAAVLGDSSRAQRTHSTRMSHVALSTLSTAVSVSRCCSRLENGLDTADRSDTQHLLQVYYKACYLLEQIWMTNLVAEGKKRKKVTKSSVQ